MNNDDGLTMADQHAFDTALLKEASELMNGQYAVEVLIGEVQPTVVLLIDALFKTQKTDTVGLAAIARVLRGVLEDAAMIEAEASIFNGLPITAFKGK